MRGSMWLVPQTRSTGDAYHRTAVRGHWRLLIAPPRACSPWRNCSVEVRAGMSAHSTADLEEFLDGMLSAEADEEELLAAAAR